MTKKIPALIGSSIVLLLFAGAGAATAQDQSKASQAEQRAKDAAQDVGQKAGEAGQKVGEAGQKAGESAKTEAQKAESALGLDHAPDQAAGTQISGNVADVSSFANRLTILNPKTGDLRSLTVRRTSQITRGGQPVALSNIRPGVTARASFVVENGVTFADRVDVGSQREKPAKVVRRATDGSPATLQVTGRVIDKSGLRNVKVLDPDRNLVVTLGVGAGSQLTRAGGAVSLDSIAKGDEVRANYQPHEGQLLVRQLEVQSVAPQ